MKVKDIISVMEEIAPSYLAMKGDRIGLHVGEENVPVNTIFLCLDATEETVKEAKEKGAQLIICHHPLIYEPLTQLNFIQPPGSTIKKVAEYGISVYAAHTNLDIAPGGVNDSLIKIIGKDLKVEAQEPLLEVDKEAGLGLGQIISLEQKRTLAEITRVVKEKISQNVKVSGVEQKEIKKIAVCGGNGRHCVYSAHKREAQVFLTGELPYHSLLEAKSLGLSVVEAGHYETEAVVVPFLEQRIKKEFRERGWQLKVVKSTVSTSPYLAIG